MEDDIARISDIRRVDEFGRIVLPVEIRFRQGIEPGDKQR